MAVLQREGDKSRNSFSLHLVLIVLDNDQVVKQFIIPAYEYKGLLYLEITANDNEFSKWLGGYRGGMQSINPITRWG